MAKSIKEAMQHAEDLVHDYANQKKLMKKMDEMYFMDWKGDKPDESKMKFTPSPMPRNALLGAIRLMTSTEPTFNVPFDANRSDAKAISEKIERICNAIWYHSGRFRGVPLEQPAVESMLRYGMMCLAITDTEDLVALMKDRGSSKAQQMQVERVLRSTPYLIEAWDPKSVYPEFNRFGLNSIFRTVTMTVAEVKAQFGDKKVMNVIKDIDSENERVAYADYWDLEKHMAWIIATIGGGERVIGGEPIIDEKHDLPCIPIVVQTSEGSYMDSDREYQAIPFLYGVEKGKLWERQNLELSYLYTNLFYLAANPTFIHETPSEEGLEFDTSVPGKAVRLRPGEQFYQLEKNVVNRDMMTGLDIAEKLVEESTIYSQALGGTGRLGANAAFSTVSLLHQAGRLPLISPQKRGGWGISTAMEYIFEMIKDKKQKGRAKTDDGSVLDFQADEIPDDLIIKAHLEVDMPQDMLAQANIAQLITQSGLASNRWVREHILNIGQSDEMEKEVWTEGASRQMYQEFLAMMMQANMMQEAGMPPEQAQGAPMPPEEHEIADPAMRAQAGLVPPMGPGHMPGEDMGL